MKTGIPLILVLCIWPLQSQDLVIPAFLEKWENSKSYLVAIAEAMPPGQYDFRPTERQMDFQDQLLHIKNNMVWLGTTYFNAQEYKGKRDVKSKLTKEETIQLLVEGFDLVSTALKNTPTTVLNEKVAFFAGDKIKLQILNLLQDHVTHHRGQLIVYLNLNNLEPPKYVGW